MNKLVCRFIDSSVRGMNGCGKNWINLCGKRR